MSQHPSQHKRKGKEAVDVPHSAKRSRFDVELLTHRCNTIIDIISSDDDNEDVPVQISSTIPGSKLASFGAREQGECSNGTKFPTLLGETTSSIFRETEGGNVEVIQQNEMHNDSLARQSSSPTKSSDLAGTSPAKGPNKRPVVDASEVSSPGVHLSTTGLHQHSYRDCKVPRKYVNGHMLEDNKGATGLKTLPTPINIFEDECVFCHSFRTSLFHGPMVHYLKGKLVPSNKGNQSNIIYVHKKCLEWAPRVWYNGDTVMNLESEINRASKLKCKRCKLSGAALGCYYEHCSKSYHVPCAVMISDCRWDIDNGYVLCPDHVSTALPCDKASSPRKESGNSSSFHKSQFSIEENIPTEYKIEDHQINQRNTSSSSLPQDKCLDKQGKIDDRLINQRNTSSSSSLPQEFKDKQRVPILLKREDQQIDQLNTSSSSLPQGCAIFSDPSCDTILRFVGTQGQCSKKERISADNRRDEKQINQNTTETNCPSNLWVFLGSALSTSEKDSVQEFASWTNAAVAKEWAENVTHVIVGQSAGCKWSRSYEVLMAMLFGKWVVTIEWIMDSLKDQITGPETSYEVRFMHDSNTSVGGTKEGRIQAAAAAPKLFSGLYFFLSAYMNPDNKQGIQDLILAAGGQILEGDSSHSLHETMDKGYFLFDGGTRVNIYKELEEAKEYAACGASVISHLKVFDAIAAYDAQVLNLGCLAPYMSA